MKDVDPKFDLRSDTVTKPTAKMREAMATAEVGDDVFDEDPTVQKLQEQSAAIVGHEAALFVPSGCMGNQIALQLHTKPGDDVILEASSHVYLYELGGMASWAGVVPRLIQGNSGRIQAAQVEAQLPPEDETMAQASLLVLENSHNHAGGTVLSLEEQNEVMAVARNAGLKVHLDGARLFHAAASLNLDPRTLAAPFDTVMFCLSKGLGAPVGSMLCGSKETIQQARVVRKRMGGGMRQVGVLGAAGLVALEYRHEVHKDNQQAKALAEALAALPWCSVDPAAIETNIVIVEVPRGEESKWLEKLSDAGILACEMGHGRLRFVTHRDLSNQDLVRVCERLALIH